MKGLYIDPGTTESGYVVWDGEKVWDRGIVPNVELIDMIPCACEMMAIEMIASYGMSVGKDVFETCVWIGRFIESGRSHGVYAQRVFRRDIKLHHCASTRATDANISRALKDRFGEVGTKKRGPNPVYQDDEYEKITKDVWQALALAVYCTDKSGKGE